MTNWKQQKEMFEMNGRNFTPTLLLLTVLSCLISCVFNACISVESSIEVYTTKRGFLVALFNQTQVRRDEWIGVGFVKDNEAATLYFANPHSQQLYLAVNWTMNESTAIEGKKLRGNRALKTELESFQLYPVAVPSIGAFHQLIYLRVGLREGNTFRNITERIIVQGSNSQSRPDVLYCQNSNRTSMANTMVVETGKLTRVSLIVNGVFDLMRLLLFTGVILLRNTVSVRSKLASTIICIFIDGFFASMKFVASVTYAALARRKTVPFIHMLTTYSIYIYVATYGTLLAFVCMSIVHSLQILRYFLARNMYQIIQRQAKVLKISNNRFIKVSRFLLSKAVMLLFILFMFIVVLCVIVTRLNLPGKHVLEATNVYYLIPVGFLVAVLASPAVLLDWLLNFKAISKRGILKGMKHHYVSDPLYYRLEILLLPLFLIPGFCVSIPYISKFKGSLAFGYCVAALTLMLYNIFYYGGFTIAMELLNMIRHGRVVVTNPPVPAQVHLDEVEKVLTNPQTFRMLKAYSVTEFSVENISIWEVLWKYKVKGGMKLRKAQKIYNLFLSSTSAMEINVPAKTKKKYKQLLESSSNGSDSDGMIPFSEFSALYSDVLANINETYCRFVVTSEYKSHVQALELETDLLRNTFAVDENLLTSYQQMDDE